MPCLSKRSKRRDICLDVDGCVVESRISFADSAKRFCDCDADAGDIACRQRRCGGDRPCEMRALRHAIEKVAGGRWLETFEFGKGELSTEPACTRDTRGLEHSMSSGIQFRSRLNASRGQTAELICYRHPEAKRRSTKHSTSMQERWPTGAYKTRPLKSIEFSNISMQSVFWKAFSIYWKQFVKEGSTKCAPMRPPKCKMRLLIHTWAAGVEKGAR